MRQVGKMSAAKKKIFYLANLGAIVPCSCSDPQPLSFRHSIRTMAEATSSEALSTLSDLYNPLAIDLQKTIQHFLASCVSRDSAIDLSLLQHYVTQPDSVQQPKVLDLLSQCLCYPPWTRSMVSLFRPIVIDLVARWTMPGFTTFLETTSTVHKIELVAKAFSVLLPVVPQVKR